MDSTRGPEDGGAGDDRAPDVMTEEPSGEAPATSTGDGTPAPDGATQDRRTTGTGIWSSPDLITVDDPRHSGRSVQEIVSWVLVALCCVMVVWTLHPDQILRDTTPTGGDMGAHVWGPRFLMDHLLPEGRLTGWSPDWYAGFPAYVFYMVVPSLLIVLLAAGPPWWAAPFLLAALGAGAWWASRRISSPVWRTLLWIVVGVLAVLCLPIPYNVAFKLVTVSGLATMPLAGFALGRAARLPFPGPVLIAGGAAAFLYERGYSILGGNILSTMAGEFAFSISLTLAVLYLAVLVRGVRTGRDRALGALLFGLVVLCHLIPAIFAALATVVLVLTRREDRVPWWDRDRFGRSMAAAIVGVVLLSLWLQQEWFPVVGTVAALLLFVSWDGRAFRYLWVALPVGGLVAAFWAVPFYLNSPYLNDMGWEKYTDYAAYLWPEPASFDMSYRNVVFGLAALGVLLSMVHRVRLGWYLALVVLALAWTFRYFPQYRLWNARILPFYYLGLYLLAALGVALVIRSLALVVGDLRRQHQEPLWVGVTGAVVALLVLLVAIGGELRVLPGGQVVASSAGDGTQVFRWMGLEFAKQNVAPGWAEYNYRGLEDKEAYAEYSDIISTMEEVGAADGCGRAMWEYEPDLDRFGTPMALMLLPYFTDGCIGSMEGLYFEASSTTPFHFLNQSELSAAPSSAQRDLPYEGLDVEKGISHLQMLGVRYYMAFSEAAVEAARQDERLTEVATIGPFQLPAPKTGTRTWSVFEIQDADLVEPLEFEPVVLKGTDDHIDGWVYGHERAEPVGDQVQGAKTPGPATIWYQDPLRWDVPLATSGPDGWARIDPEDTAPPRNKVPAAEVSNVRTTTDTISFDVDRVGTPVVVKTSYFPNWKASGAEGPYRVSPNLMVVVPTEKHVTLSYGTTGIDVLGWVLTALGLGLVLLLAVRDQRRRDDQLVLVGALEPPPPAGPSLDSLDSPGPDDGAEDGPDGGAGESSGALDGDGPEEDDTGPGTGPPPPS